MKSFCRMVVQGYSPGKCLTLMPDNSLKPACQVTLRKMGDSWSRLIKSITLSRPEDYLSIYQSGCNHECLKCHSWYFTKIYSGSWVTTDEIAEIACRYEEMVTVLEPRSRATMFHASDLCRHCGLCVTEGRRSEFCPRKLSRDQVVFSPQGWGPARNIVSFTGGDLTCCPEFYAEVAEKIKDECRKTWVLIETNGYGLTPRNLETLSSSGVDSFWLDIKAYDGEVYKKLCGVTNEWILKSIEEIVRFGFTLEVLTLFIPGWVETNQIVEIAKLIHEVDSEIPFMILAFFPEYKLINNRPPTLTEMINAYLAVKEIGLKNVKLGNCHVFAKSKDDWETLIDCVGLESVG